MRFEVERKEKPYWMYDIEEHETEEGKKLGEVVGNLEFNPYEKEPEEQWALVTLALRVHGLKIVEMTDADKTES